MVRFERLDVLRRKIRQDDVEELGKPTWALIREAIRAGRSEEALELLEYGCEGDKANNDSLTAFVSCTLTNLASFGEELLEKMMRERYTPTIVDWLARTPGPLESLYRIAEIQRYHYGEIAITEEPDRYVVRMDPCGTGGRVWRTQNVGTTKKAYPWTWNRTGIPYYCVHCSLMWEIIPIELRGYPIRISVLGEKPESPCVSYLYKRPELIPEEYFLTVGKTKTIK